MAVDSHTDSDPVLVVQPRHTASAAVLGKRPEAEVTAPLRTRPNSKNPGPLLRATT